MAPALLGTRKTNMNKLSFCPTVSQKISRYANLITMHCNNTVIEVYHVTYPLEQESVNYSLQAKSLGPS